MKITQKQRDRMRRNYWQLQETEEDCKIVFMPKGYTPPLTYYRPGFWEPKFIPTVWREEMPNYWKPIVEGLEIALHEQDPYTFNEWMLAAIDRTDSPLELWWHVGEYLANSKLKTWSEWRDRFLEYEYPKICETRSQLASVQLTYEAGLRQAAIDQDEATARALILNMASGAPEIKQMIGGTMLSLDIDDADHAAVWLLELTSELLGEEEADQLWNGTKDKLEAQWREKGVEPVEDEQELLHRCLEASNSQ